MPSSAFKKAHFEVLFAQSPVDRLAEYAKEINVGLIVVETRKASHGCFLVTLQTVCQR